MENNNGKGIFYGVIGIATLIVAIVGATFAYFSATYETSNTAINITSYSGFSVSLSMSKIAPSVAVNNLIPLESAKLSMALEHKVKDGNQNEVLNPCIDSNGDQVCAIYEMTLTNNGDSAVDVIGYLSADVNEYETDNLKYQVFNCSDTDSDNVADKFDAIQDSGAVNAPHTPDASLSAEDKATFINNLPKFKVTSGEEDNTILKLPAKLEGEDAPSAKLCLVLWLEDTKSPQNVDQGKRFAGKVTFNASSSNAGGSQELFARFN